MLQAAVHAFRAYQCDCVRVIAARRALTACARAAEKTLGVLNGTLGRGGPDGLYHLSLTADGTIGFSDLRKYKVGRRADRVPRAAPALPPRR